MSHSLLHHVTSESSGTSEKGKTVEQNVLDILDGVLTGYIAPLPQTPIDGRLPSPEPVMFRP